MVSSGNILWIYGDENDKNKANCCFYPVPALQSYCKCLCCILVKSFSLACNAGIFHVQAVERAQDNKFCWRIWRRPGSRKSKGKKYFLLLCPSHSFVVQRVIHFLGTRSSPLRAFSSGISNRNRTAHFQNERKPEASVSASWIIGSCGSHAHLFSTSWTPCAPKRSHNWTRAHSRPSFPLSLKVG